VRFRHPAHPGRAVRLAYCMNVHPAETLESLLAGIEAITVPLRQRLAPGKRFGVGMYLAAPVAAELARGEGLESLAACLERHDLEPFTFNAFPYGGFHTDGLKEGVYRPTWAEPARLEYTEQVIAVATRLARGDLEHLSISTHPGSYGEWVTGPRDLHELARGFARLAPVLAAADPRVVLCLEAEPRASAGNQAQLAEFLAVLGPRVGAVSEGATRSYGVCLDCCHAAVEFEDPAGAVGLASGAGPIGKVQFTSALALLEPGSNPEGRAALLALDEPRYLHQVSAPGGLGVSDLPELRRLLEGPEAETWLAADEWRCHFHVPVDLAQVGGLTTTRSHGEATLRAALDPARWGTRDLHVEIETYTWDVLPGPARGAGDLVDGLEREYHAAIAVLEAEGWRPD
jgi:Xylose isomerase-like TIM barrel